MLRARSAFFDLPTMQGTPSIGHAGTRPQVMDPPPYSQDFYSHKFTRIISTSVG